VGRHTVTREPKARGCCFVPLNSGCRLPCWLAKAVSCVEVKRYQGVTGAPGRGAVVMHERIAVVARGWLLYWGMLGVAAKCRAITSVCMCVCAVSRMAVFTGTSAKRPLSCHMSGSRFSFSHHFNIHFTEHSLLDPNQLTSSILHNLLGIGDCYMAAMCQQQPV
jgi:hypothetical protein